jgi:archaellum component FlaC
MKRDLDGLAARLRNLDAGDYTQQVQQDVIETLRELLEVIKEELNRRQGEQQGGDAGEGENEDNLLPTSAELKMLKSLQVRVNKRTSTFDRMVKKEEEERLRIAEKQDNVGALTRSMADALNRQEDQ